jgi:hypothetical protein
MRNVSNISLKNVMKSAIRASVQYLILVVIRESKLAMAIISVTVCKHQPLLNLIIPPIFVIDSNI